MKLIAILVFVVIFACTPCAVAGSEVAAYLGFGVFVLLGIAGIVSDLLK
jgi:hypothetical protein